MEDYHPSDELSDDEKPAEPPQGILIANEQRLMPVDEDRLRCAVQAVLDDAAIHSAMISIAVVNDAASHAINHRYLQHDWPTDILSFVLENEGDHLEGELVASAETALKMADRYGWTPAEELLLYVIHGALHLVGYRDKAPEETAQMRAAEQQVLRQLGVTLPADHERPALSVSEAARGESPTS